MANEANPSHRVASLLSGRYEPLLLLLLASAVGIGVDRVVALPPAVWWCVALLAMLLWALAWRSSAKLCGSLLVLLAATSLSGAWHHARWHTVPATHVVAQIREEAQPICLKARLLSSPRIVPAPPATPLRAIPQGDRSRCEVEIVSVRHDRQWKLASGQARLTVDGHLLGLHVGDELLVFAVYQRPTPALNPGEFDFANFERSERRWCNLSAELPECVSIVQQGSSLNIARWLDELRRAGDFQLRRFISPARAPLASAVLLGEREFLDADRNQRFLVTGTVHLLAISGLNLAILVYVFWVLGRTGLLSRRGTLAAAIAFAVSYALLTDAEPPVLRAAVLITVFCLARWSGRPTSPWHVLAISALVVLAWNPASLFHVGTQLSFLAVAVLSWFNPLLTIREPADPLDRLIAHTRPWPWRAGKHSLRLAWQAFATGGIVWLLTTPLVWLHCHLISPIALPLNPLVALPMAVSLFSGFAVLVLGWLAPPLGALAGALCDVSLGAMENAIARSEQILAGYHWLPAPPAWWVAVFYVAVTVSAITPILRTRKLWVTAFAVVWLMVAIYLAMPLLSATTARPLAATFISVGHGAAVLVELPDGRNLLYDCGRMGSPLSGARPIASVLWARGITHLDAIVISHADSDHYNAIPEIMERFSVGAVYVSTVMWDGTSAGPETLRQAIHRLHVPVVTVRSGDRLRTPGDNVPEFARTTLEVLHPPRGGVFGTDNANSIVLLIEHEGRRVLLTGDLETRGLSDLLAEPAIDIDVLMVPHHGSTRSNPRGLAEWCRPEHVVISGARDLELGRDPEIVAQAFHVAGAHVYHTSQHGAIRFELSRDGVLATPHRRPPVQTEGSVYFQPVFESR